MVILRKKRRYFMRKMVIFGTGGFAREVLQILKDYENTNKMLEEDVSFLGFLDEDETKYGTLLHGNPVLGGFNWLEENKDVEVIIGIGNPEAKKKIADRIKTIHEFQFPNIVHSNVVMGDYIKLGEGNIICHGNILTTDIQIKNFVTINLNCTVGHDTVICDYVTVSPGVNVSGNVNIGEGTDLGTNCTIIQGREIGEWSIVGAGAVVVKDIPSFSTSVGNPAKVIKERERTHS
jgi:sugar O-acyltransferase (sialic acid O-acetyltransferase NeuD family)